MWEKRAQTRDKKARKVSRVMQKSMHRLETRRQETVSKTNMGDEGKARTYQRQEAEKRLGKTNTGGGGKARTY
jgi:hypothetical protein